MADSSSNNPAAVDQFITITNADPATARFFLSAANGDCDAAVSAFFESDGLIPSHAGVGPAIPTPTTPAAALPPPPPPPPSSSSSRRPPPTTTGGGGGPGRIATLGSLARSRAADNDDDDDENDPGYYAGGEKSGQMIQDPRKRNHNNNNNRPSSSSSNHHRSSRINTLNNNNNNNNNTDDNNNMNAATGLADAILQQAQARSRDPGLVDAERAEFEGPQLFTGAGYRLGTTPGDGPARPTVIGRRNVTRVLTLYANGFTVDDGPLRRFDDPTNEEFLADVNRGVVPKEMEQPDIGDVSITLVDQKRTQYDRKRHGGGGGGARRVGGAGSSGVVLGGSGSSNSNGNANSSRRRMAGSVISNGGPNNNNSANGNDGIIPFSGDGNRLSSSSSSTTTTTPTPTNTAASTADTDMHMRDNNNNESTVTGEDMLLPSVDNSMPTARVQVRLLDGSRIVATLNMTHTVGHLRQYVRASTQQRGGGMPPQRFTLATTFPRVVLSDDKVSIADAKLNGAVVVQSLN